MNQKKPTVSILIAALNEEKIIQKTVKHCLKNTLYDCKVYVVIDSKTKDNTKNLAKRAGAVVVDTGKWLGKGAALRIALRSVNSEYTVQIDADYQFLPSDIPRLIEALIKGNDVALGSRFEHGSEVEEGSVTKFRFIGIIFLSLLTSIATGIKISDVLAGFKAFKTTVLKDLDLQVNHYGYEAEEVIKAAKKRYKISNVPIHYRKRRYGKSNVIPLKHGFLFLATILKEAFL